jgi:hypothetical protein
VIYEYPILLLGLIGKRDSLSGRRERSLEDAGTVTYVQMINAEPFRRHPRRIVEHNVHYV